VVDVRRTGRIWESGKINKLTFKLVPEQSTEAKRN
jgi:hypothetical protein